MGSKERVSTPDQQVEDTCVHCGEKVPMIDRKVDAMHPFCTRALAHQDLSDFPITEFDRGLTKYPVE